MLLSKLILVSNRKSISFGEINALDEYLTNKYVTDDGELFVILSII